MVDAGHLDDVLDVIDDVVDAAGRDGMLLAPLLQGGLEFLLLGVLLLQVAADLEHVLRHRAPSGVMKPE